MGRAPLQPMGIRMGLMMTMTVRTLLACAPFIQACRRPFFRGAHCAWTRQLCAFLHQSAAGKQPCKHFCMTARLQLQH